MNDDANLHEGLFVLSEARIDKARKMRRVLQALMSLNIIVIAGMILSMGMDNVYVAYVTFFLGMGLVSAVNYAFVLAMRSPDIVEASVYLGTVPYLSVLGVTYVWFMASELLLRAKILESHFEHLVFWAMGGVHLGLVLVALIARRTYVYCILFGLNVVALVFPSTNTHLVASLPQTASRLAALFVINCIVELTAKDPVVKIANSGPTKLSILLLRMGRASIERCAMVSWVLIVPITFVGAGAAACVAIHEIMRRVQGESVTETPTEKARLEEYDYEAVVRDLRAVQPVVI